MDNNFEKIYKRNSFKVGKGEIIIFVNIELNISALQINSWKMIFSTCKIEIKYITLFESAVY